MQFDEQTAKRLESIYLTPDVVAQRREMLRVLDPKAGESVLDIGSGPGFLSLEIAARLGPSGKVVGIDCADAMIGISRERLGKADTEAQVKFQKGDATAIPFPEATFDLAVASQVYELIGDVAEALAEAHQVLKTFGRLLVVDTDWDSVVWHSSNPERMKRVLRAWNDHLVDARLPRTLPRKLREAGFAVQKCLVVPMLNTDCDSNRFSHGLISAIAAFVPGRHGVTAEEAEGWASDLRTLGDKGEYFFNLNRYLFLATKPAGARVRPTLS